MMVTEVHHSSLTLVFENLPTIKGKIKKIKHENFWEVGSQGSTPAPGVFAGDTSLYVCNGACRKLCRDP